MPLHLNLAALTGDELERLLGVEAAQKLRPDLSRARMEGKAYRGPEVAPELRFELVEEREWGSTVEHTRKLRAYRDALRELEYHEHGTLYAPGLQGARHHVAFTGHTDTAVAVRWSETPEGVTEGPFLQFVTVLRDRASGVAAVLTTTSVTPLAPAPSEEVAVRHVPGGSPAEAHTAHRSEVTRHARGVKVATVTDWQRSWQALRALNVNAWSRRGLLLEA